MRNQHSLSDTLRTFFASAAIAAASLSTSMLSTGVANADDSEASITITSPAAGQAVATEASVIIRGSDSGQPVVAIRSKAEKGPWWIQDSAVKSRPGEYETKVRFGNDSTPDGVRFEIAVMFEPNESAASVWKLGSTLEKLPENVELSEIVEVVLDRAEALRQGASFDAELLSPLPDVKVARLQDVVFQMKESELGLPLLLVRSTERNSPWWIQNSLKRDSDGNLSGLARIGGERTPAGSQFLIVLAFPNTDVNSKSLIPGSSLSDLKQFQRSRVFSVTTSGEESSTITTVANDSSAATNES